MFTLLTCPIRCTRSSAWIRTCRGKERQRHPVMSVKQSIFVFNQSFCRALIPLSRRKTIFNHVSRKLSRLYFFSEVAAANRWTSQTVTTFTCRLSNWFSSAFFLLFSAANSSLGHFTGESLFYGKTKKGANGIKVAIISHTKKAASNFSPLGSRRARRRRPGPPSAGWGPCWPPWWTGRPRWPWTNTGTSRTAAAARLTGWSRQYGCNWHSEWDKKNLLLIYLFIPVTSGATSCNT